MKTKTLKQQIIEAFMLDTTKHANCHTLKELDGALFAELVAQSATTGKAETFRCFGNFAGGIPAIRENGEWQFGARIPYAQRTEKQLISQDELGKLVAIKNALEAIKDETSELHRYYTKIEARISRLEAAKIKASAENYRKLLLQKLADLSIEELEALINGHLING